MHYKVLTSKVHKVSSSKLNKVQKTCYVKINWPTLFSKTKRIVQNTICFLFLPFFFILLKKNHLEWNAWMLCNANPRNKKKTQNQKTMATKNRAMKHKDHVRKTQLDRVFCIQNLLDAPWALEFLFTLEWLSTQGLE